MINTKDTRLGFVGGGKMVECILKGMFRGGAVEAKRVFVTDVAPKRLDYLRERYGVHAVAAQNGEGYDRIARECTAVVLGVPPQAADDALAALRPRLTPANTLITIMGGMPCAFVEERLPGVPVVRIMPNVPMEVAAGVAGLVPGKDAAPDRVELVTALFRAVGLVVPMDESNMDALTAISGCGPAFLGVLAQAMADAGVQLGLPRETAEALAAQTLVGTGRMILEERLQPEALKDSVCTSGGSTIAGVYALERHGFRFAIGDAMLQAYSRMRGIAREEENK